MSKLIIGVDEVGRGAWAGPIVGVAYVCYDRQANVRDSKIITRHDRVEIAGNLRKPKAGEWCESWVGASTIDSKGIDWANNEVLRASIIGLISLNFDLYSDKDIEVYVDGIKPVVGLPSSIKQHCIIKGDSKIYEISSASIIAKVERDAWMGNQELRCSQFGKSYGWKDNCGYGTAGHKEAIKKYGLTDLHRRTFIHF